jgi:hypothetical protein
MADKRGAAERSGVAEPEAVDRLEPEDKPGAPGQVEAEPLAVEQALPRNQGRAPAAEPG